MNPKSVNLISVISTMMAFWASILLLNMMNVGSMVIGILLSTSVGIVVGSVVFSKIYGSRVVSNSETVTRSYRDQKISKISISVVLGFILANFLHFFLYTNQIIAGRCFNPRLWGGSCEFSVEGWRRTIFTGEHFPIYALTVFGVIFALIFLFIAAKYLKDETKNP